MLKIDLHTHSLGSPDGGLRERHYKTMLERRGLDIIAVTDHDTIEFAQKLHAELGNRIIVGEEITTQEGEIIGLFLKEAVPAGLSLKQTVQAIRRQRGLIYVPHPFETMRKGLPEAALESIAEHIDIMEVRNGRAVFQNKREDALHWATMHRVPGAASSDAHGWYGWGRTYSEVEALPTPDTLRRLLERARYADGTVGLRGLLYPKLHRLRKRRLP